MRPRWSLYSYFGCVYACVWGSLKPGISPRFHKRAETPQALLVHGWSLVPLEIWFLHSVGFMHRAPCRSQLTHQHHP